MGDLYLYGQHAVLAALKNPRRRLKRLYLAAEHKVTASCSITITEKSTFSRLLPQGAIHQGYALATEPLEQPSLDDILDTAPKHLLVLDQVTDPQNIGAILRTAAAFGVQAVVVQDRHAPNETSAMVKTACGAFERIDYVAVTNLSRSLEALKNAGYWCIGFSERGREVFTPRHAADKTAFVFGAEGDGLRRLVAQTCDALVRLPTVPDFPSLNVGAAVAATLGSYAAYK